MENKIRKYKSEKTEDYGGEIVLTKAQMSIYGKLLNSNSFDGIESSKIDIKRIVNVINTKSAKQRKIKE